MNLNKFELTTLYEISKILASSLNLKTTLKSVMKILSDFLDMKRGTVVLKKDNKLSIEAAYGLSPVEIKRGKYRLGEGIIGRVAKSGYPVVIPNVGEEPLFLNKTKARKKIMKDNISFLCVPIAYKHEVLGVLSVDKLFSSKRVSFEEDIRILKIIALLIANTVKLSQQIEEEKRELIEERDELKWKLKSKYKIENIVGKSKRMQEVFEAVYKVAPSKATVLLMGESGTGKELIARAIHFMGKRAEGPFIKFNCASIPEGLLESELFGHEKGAFTGAISTRKGKFELAEKGSIFLDEIGDLPLNLQPKILRVLQEREFERVGSEKTIQVDLRVIAATSRNLDELVSEKKFREDLFYRLNVIPIYLPPLRERKIDIPELIYYFLMKYNKENNREIKFSPDSINIMIEYRWPGNVRELENTIERLVIMSSSDWITPSDLPINITTPMVNKKIIDKTLPDALEQTERESIINALKTTNGVHAKAARLLGLTQRQIGYKIKKFGI